MNTLDINPGQDPEGPSKADENAPERQTPDPPATKNSHKKILLMILVFLLFLFISASIGAIFGFMGGTVGQKFEHKLSNRFPKLFSLSKPDLNQEIIKQRMIEEDSSVIDVVEKSSPAVVSIIISKDIPKVQNYFFNPFDPFGSIPDDFNPLGEGRGGTNDNENPSGNGSGQKQKIGGGTGFLITPDGYIVTNKHVVSDSQADYTVITNDQKEHPATVLAKDPVNDIAILKIEGSDYPTLSLGNSDGIKIGQTVIAIGNSLGEFSNSVSKGIISGLKRNVTASSGGLGQTEKLSNIIQTDAAINPGNSGGPLLNIGGEVIGVNVAMAQGAENIGFAIPVNQIVKVVNQVKDTGKISTPYIGVRYLVINDQLKKDNNLDYDYGAVVIRGERISDLAVIPGSPADKAGIVENDIILEIDGTKVDDENTLTDIIARHSVGDEVTLKIWHKGDEKTVRVKLEERKQ